MSRSTQPGRKRVFLTLDGIRGIAALAVVVYHTAGFFGDLELPSAYLAVDLFFVMSGFVISHAYDGRLEGGLGAGAFMRQRLIRLYPLYLIGTLIAFVHVAAVLGLGVWTAWTMPGLAIAGALALFMLPAPPSPNKENIYPLNDPSWSLLYELGINAVFAAWHRQLSLRVIALVMTGAALMLVVFASYLGALKFGVTWQTAGVAIARVSFSFFAGVLIYRLLALRGLPRIGLPAWTILAAVLAICAVPASGTNRAIFDIICVLIVLPLLVTAAAMTEPARFTGLYRMLGQTSYALYVVHVPLSLLFGDILARLAGVDLKASAPWGGFVFLGFSLAVAWALHRFADGPARRLMARIWSAPEPRAQAASA